MGRAVCVFDLGTMRGGARAQSPTQNPHRHETFMNNNNNNNEVKSVKKSSTLCPPDRNAGPAVLKTGSPTGASATTHSQPKRSQQASTATGIHCSGIVNMRDPSRRA